MSGHTKGPWWISGEGTIRAGRTGWIAKVLWRNRTANARLIVAAPDLLKACQIAIECFGDEEGESAEGALADIRDAIAKAEHSRAIDVQYDTIRCPECGFGRIRGYCDGRLECTDCGANWRPETAKAEPHD